MASFALANTPFPDDTEVGAWDATGFSVLPTNGPLGDAVTTATASGRSVSFTGLKNATPYFAAAFVDGKWLWRRFMTSAASEPEAWENALAGLGLADLSDVAVGSPEAGDLIVFDGASWVRVPKGQPGESMIFHKDGTVTHDRSIIYAKGWGVTGNESAGEGAAANEALAAASASPAGAEVKFPTGTILCEETVENRARCWFNGSGPGTVFKAAAGLNADVISTLEAGAGGQDECMWSHFTVDGNGTNNTAGRGLVMDSRKGRAWGIAVHYSYEDNIVQTRSAAEQTKEYGGSDFHIDRWLAWGSKTGNGLTIDSNDVVVGSGTSIFNAKANFENTAKGSAVVLKGVHSWGECEYGFRFKGSFSATQCQSEGATKALVRCEAGGTWTGGQVFTSTSARNVPGFEVTANAARIVVIGCVGKELGTGGMFRASAASAGSGSIISSCTCDQGNLSGEHPVFTAAEGSSWSGNVKVDVRFKGSEVIAGEAWPVYSVVAANELVIESAAAYVRVTGATEIKRVKPTFPGHVVRFRMTSTAKWLDGENLHIEGNFEGGPDRIITAECDGTNWIESGRSTN